VALTLLMPSIAWQAHLGGGVAGLVLGLIFALIPRR
jgi:rhomboid protease GluP